MSMRLKQMLVIQSLPSTPLRTNVLEAGANFCFPWILHFSWPNKPSFDTNKPSFGTNMSSFVQTSLLWKAEKCYAISKKFTSYRVWLLFFYLFIFSPGEHFASYKSNLNQHLTAGFSSTFSFFKKLIIRSLSFLKIHHPCSLKDDNG